MSDTKFRRASIEDVPLVLEFIKELADYEKLSSEVVATEQTITEWMFEKGKA